jgi:hypothetical protein
VVEEEEKMEIVGGVFDETEHGEGLKRATGAAASKGGMKEDHKNENEEQAPKRTKYWDPMTTITEEFLQVPVGIHARFSKIEYQKLNKAGVGNVRALVGFSEDKLENKIGLLPGSVSAIVQFIQEQKGKNDEH